MIKKLLPKKMTKKLFELPHSDFCSFCYIPIKITLAKHLTKLPKKPDIQRDPEVYKMMTGAKENRSTCL